MLVQKENLLYNYEYEKVVVKAKKEREIWKWIILVGCLLFQMIPYCVALNLANVFAGSDWYVWMGQDNTLLNLTFTVGALGAAFVAPSIAKWMGKPINMRVVYSIGVVLAMAGFAILGVNAVLFDKGIGNKGLYIVLLYIPTVVTQIGVMVFSGLGVNNLISKWWEPEKRGFALGIAFAGGSLGNIWMQQLVGVLSKAFGNTMFTGKGNPEDFGYIPVSHTEIQINHNFDDQWATYVILAGMGLVAGIIIAMFACRKPLPPIDIIKAKATKENIEINKKPVLEASPLVTQKYPPYWILCVGYLILQMGTVHASANGQIVQMATAPANNLDYTDIMAVGGTIFGVTCLVGNVGGGILNDKLGPTKSILLSGTVQVIAIVCLMLSVQTPGLVYAYFAFAGLSVYVYTSTPAFLCGRLYGPGQSNNQMAILGVFIAIGFAIVNSISGSLMEVEESSIIFGKTTTGTTMYLEIFAIVCMALGTLIVVICSAIITNKGIKGLLEYSPTKYSRVIYFKHSMAIRLASMRILFTKKDFRVNNEKRDQKGEDKRAKNAYYNSYEEYKKAVEETFKSKKLTANEISLLSMVFFYTVVSKKELIELSNLKDIEKEIKSLVSKKFINEIQLGQNFAYRLTKDSEEALKPFEHDFHAKYPNIEKEANNVELLMHKLDSKAEAKVQKLNHKLELANAIVIDELKKEALINKSNNILEKLNAKKESLKSKLESKDEWSKYKVDYALAEKTLSAEALKTKLDVAKENKIKECHKKIAIANYVSNYNKSQQIDGHVLLINYYNDTWAKYNEIITKDVTYSLESKIDKLNNNITRKQNKLNKLSSQKESMNI